MVLGYFCACVGAYTGTLCQNKIPLCLAESKPCFNGGSCAVDKCVCLSNFTGERCQTYSKILNL